MIDLLIFIGKFILAVVLCALLLAPIIIAMSAENGFCYKPRPKPSKSPNEVKAKIKPK